MLEVISILLALLIGFLLVQVSIRCETCSRAGPLRCFDAALGAGVGMGLTSIIFLLLDVSGVASPAAIFGIDIVLVGGLGVAMACGREPAASAPVRTELRSGFRWTWLLALAFGTVLLMSGIRLVQMAAALPVGEWDAWALWNLRAKFLAGPGGAWRYALSPLLKNTHPDYPLLLSAFVARVWKAGGTMDAIVPIVTALGVLRRADRASGERGRAAARRRFGVVGGPGDSLHHVAADLGSLAICRYSARILLSGRHRAVLPGSFANGQASAGRCSGRGFAPVWRPGLRTKGSRFWSRSRWYIWRSRCGSGGPRRLWSEPDGCWRAQFPECFSHCGSSFSWRRRWIRWSRKAHRAWRACTTPAVTRKWRADSSTTCSIWDRACRIL